MIARDSASQLLGKRSHENVDDAAGEAEVRRQEVIQDEGQPVVEGQNVIQQEEPQIVEEAPVNADAGPLEPQPP